MQIKPKYFLAVCNFYILLPEVNFLPGLISLYRESSKYCLEEGDHVLVIGKIISVKEPTLSGDNPDDLVRVEAVLEEVEDSIDASLASTNYDVAIIALSHGTQAWGYNL